MQFSQRLLDVLGNQRQWDAVAIEPKLDQMATITSYHSRFQGNRFIGFVRMGQGGPVEMSTTRRVRMVSDEGRDVKCSKVLLTFNLRCRSLQASMNALIHVVDHANKSYEADHLGWEDVISGARDLLTCRDLGRFAALCNDDHDAVEGEYHLYEEWQSLFLGCPTYIWIRNGVRVTRKMKGATKRAGVAATKPMAEANISLRITSGWCMPSGSHSIRTKRGDTANSRYVRILLLPITLCIIGL